MTIDPNDIDRLTPPELVTLDDPPASKPACIEFLLDVAVDAGRVDDREQALTDLLRREEEATTGVGMGIGIPHAETTAASRPSVVFARSDEGVDFDAMDERPAHLLFMLLVPEQGGEEHLEILRTLSRALMYAEVRDSLRTADSADEVRGVLKEAVSG
jgi:PTS system fructose-specific IIA component